MKFIIIYRRINRPIVVSQVVWIKMEISAFWHRAWRWLSTNNCTPSTFTTKHNSLRTNHWYVSPNQSLLRHLNSPTPRRQLFHFASHQLTLVWFFERARLIFCFCFLRGTIFPIFGMSSCRETRSAAMTTRLPDSAEVWWVYSSTDSEKPGLFREVCDREKSLRRQTNVKNM